MTTGREPSIGGDKQINTSGAEPKLGGEAAILHLVEMLEHPDRKVRYRAALKLAESGDDRVFDTLIEMLQEENGTSRLRERAALALGQLGDERAIEPLLALMDFIDVYYVVSALIQIGGDRALDIVEELFFSRWNDRSVNRAIQENVPKFGGQRTIAFLIGVLEDNSGPSLRHTDLITATLKRMGSRAVEPLLPLLRHESRYVRLRAVRVLDGINDPRLVEPLTALLDDEHPEVVIGAIHALGKLDDPQIVYLLTDLIEHPDLSIAKAAVISLGELGDERAVVPLLRNLKHGDSPPKDYTIQALGKIGGSRAVRFLGEALMFEIRSSGKAYALAEIGSEEAAQALLATIQHGLKKDVRRSAASALGQIKGLPLDESLVVPLLHHPDAWIRSTAAGMLGGYRSEHVVEELMEALSDQDKEVRRWAIISLGRSGDSRAIEPLTAALYDSDTWIRRDAAYALGELGDNRAFEPLIDTLFNNLEYQYIVESTARALVKLGDRRAVEPLLDLAANQGRPVSVCAVEALGDLGDTRAVEPLIEILNNFDRVSVHTAKALGKLGDERAVESLKVAMYRADREEFPDRELFAACEAALKRIGTPEALAAIEDLPFRDLGDEQ